MRSVMSRGRKRLEGGLADKNGALLALIADASAEWPVTTAAADPSARSIVTDAAGDTVTP